MVFGINKTTFILLFVFSISLNVFSQTTQYKVAIQYSNALMSKTDKFQFSLNGSDRITMDFANRTVDFPTKLRTGQHYNITQLSGSRACMSGHRL